MQISQRIKNCDWLINRQCSPEAQAGGGFAGYSFPKYRLLLLLKT